MPIVTESTKEQHKSIVRPVVLSVVNDLIRVMRLDPSCEIIFRGYSELAMLPNGRIGEKYRNGEQPIRTPGSARIFVTLDEEPADASILTMPVLYPENRYVLHDPSLGISIKPVYLRSAITINISQRFKSKAAADSWYSHMQQLLARNVQTLIHRVSYHHSIPNTFVGALRDMWQYRERVAGYNQSFSEWMESILTPRATITTDNAGKNLDLSIAETNFNIQGDLDFDNTPRPVKANALGNWKAEFSYKFEYDKAIEYVFKYPISIHNQLLTPDFIPKQIPTSYRDGPYDKPATMHRAEGVANEVGVTDDSYFPWYIHPVYDEWRPRDLFDGHIMQNSTLITIEPDKPKELVNLNELGEYELCQSVKNYLQYIGRRMFAHRASAIQICIYEGDIRIDPSALHVDDNLTITCDWELDLRKVYHLVIYMDSDVAGWTELTVSEFLEDGWFAHLILGTMYPSLVGNEYWPPVDTEGRITPLDWSNFVTQLKYTRERFGQPAFNDKLLIGSYTIWAKHKD